MPIPTQIFVGFNADFYDVQFYFIIIGKIIHWKNKGKWSGRGSSQHSMQVKYLKRICLQRNVLIHGIGFGHDAMFNMYHFACRISPIYNYIYSWLHLLSHILETKVCVWGDVYNENKVISDISPGTDQRNKNIFGCDVITGVHGVMQHLTRTVTLGSYMQSHIYCPSYSLWKFWTDRI